MNADRIRATVKILKNSKTSGPLCLLAPPPGVEISGDPDFARDNAVETILDLFAPKGRAVPLCLQASAGTVRRIILGKHDLPFVQGPDGIQFTLPALHDDEVGSGEIHTIIRRDSVELRIEHADIRRRAGDYATGDFPARQHRAALSLEFALREAVQALGLDRWASDTRMGPILIMGFDTNNPHGHRDFPPHIHMHMFQPRKGAPIGHYYLSRNCLFSHAIVGYRNDPRPDLTIAPGTPFTTTGIDDKPVFTATITLEGWLRIVSPSGEQCLIRPNGAGFDSGAVLCHPDGRCIAVHAKSDFSAGIVEVLIGAHCERHHFDTDTGWLISSFSETIAQIAE